MRKLIPFVFLLFIGAFFFFPAESRACFQCINFICIDDIPPHASCDSGTNPRYCIASGECHQPHTPRITYSIIRAERSPEVKIATTTKSLINAKKVTKQ